MEGEPTEYSQELLFDPMDRQEAEQPDEPLDEMMEDDVMTERH